MEYETLDQEEVRKVIRGERIRSIDEVLDGERVEAEGGAAATSGAVGRVGQAQTAGDRAG